MVHKKRLLVVFLAVIVCAGLLPAFANGAANEPKPITFTIVAQPPGTGPYGFAATLAKFMNDALPAGSTVNVIPRGGSMANPTTLDMGKADVGNSAGTATVWAWEGFPDVYAKYGAHKNIRRVTMGNVTVNYLMMMARKAYVEETGIDTLEKILNAKEMPRIAIKPPGSDVPPLFITMFRNMGKELDDYRKAGKLIQIQPAQIGEMMRDSRVDIYFESVPLNHPAVTEIALTNDLYFIPVPPAAVEGLTKIGSQPIVLKAGSYRGLDRDYPTASTGNNFLASKDAPEWAVYLFTKAMHERKDEFIKENPPANTWNPEADIKLNALNPVPLHPGAARYFREIGWIK